MRACPGQFLAQGGGACVSSCAYYEPAGLDYRCVEGCVARFSASVGGRRVCVEACADVNQYEKEGSRECVSGCGSLYYAGTRCLSECTQRVFVYGQNKYCVSVAELPAQNYETASGGISCLSEKQAVLETVS